ncbi:hypothetical protein PFISCL1PPCAC_4480 [Pristionchus fissidentatus]|uniref:AMP-binding protein n=1 Tax=Pristionchus fissidentatus TaxID=1538716 RepID=A0AAV5V4J8_9BILA|nr:hypothetical protein PFISCL1PPCAC_4480 [Pristionchus fissidentatus]
MVYDSPFGQFPQCTVPVHEIILDKIDQVIREEPNRVAYISAVDASQRMTYMQLKEQAFSVAQFLHNRGFVKQIAATVTSNCMEYMSFFLGVSLQGGALSGASSMFTEYELRRQFEDSGCTVVFTDEKSLVKARKAAQGLTAIKTIIILGNTAPAGCYSWADIASTRPDKKRHLPTINVEEDIVFLPYSSGTTGTPKGVMLTHKNYGTMLNIVQATRAASLRAKGVDPESVRDTLLLLLPFYHVFGFTMMCNVILFKTTSVMLSKFEPDLFLRSIQNYKITVLSIVPPILVFLAKDPRCDNYDLTSVKMIKCGAAAVGKSLIDEVKRRYPNLEGVRQGYGMTELSLGSHLADAADINKIGCVGKLAPGLQMKIVNPSSGKELPQGEAGEICVRGAIVMRGYLGKTRETAETIRDGWLHTGDIGYCDVEGDLFIVDRLKELIKVNGIQVPPAELESLLLGHPLIADAAVVGIPDEKAGELPKAFIVRKDKRLNEQQVIDFVKEKVAHYKQLKGGVEFIDVIPKSEAGKILRRQLRDRQKSKI